MTAPVDQVSVAIVPDFRGFATEMRRSVDAAMREATARIDAAMEGIERDVAAAGTNLGREFQAGGESAERSFRELDLTASRALHGVQAQTAVATAELRTMGAAGATAGAGIAGGMAIATSAILGVGAAVGLGLAAITGMGLTAAAKMEQTQIQFKSLLGSAELGKRVLAELQAFAAKTPFELLDVTPVAARFFTLSQTLGMAKTDVTKFLTTVGNLVSVTGGGAFAMERVAFAMGQIASKGRLGAQDLNQIGDALVGFPVREKIAAELGISVAEAMQQMENGSIDARTGLQALMRAMEKYPAAAGAMEAQSQTLIGLFSTFKDEINLALIDAFQPVIPSVKKALADLTPVIGEALTDLAPALGEVLTALMPLVGQFIKAFTPAIIPIIKAFGTALTNLAESGMIEKFGEAFTELVEAGVVQQLPVLFEFMIAVMQLMIPVLLLLAAALRVTAPVLGIFADSIHELNRALGMIDWPAVGSAIGSFFTDLWGHISGFFADIGGAAMGLPGVVQIAFEKLVNAAKTKIGEMITTVKEIPGRIHTALIGLGTLLVDAGANVVRGLWNGIKSMGGWLISRIKGFVRDNIVNAVKDALLSHSPSQVMADEVGRTIPAGIAVGIEDGTPALHRLLAGLVTPGMVTADAGTGATGGITFGPGSIVIQFSGAQPTAAQAYNTGVQVGEGVMAAISRRNVTTNVKQRG